MLNIGKHAKTMENLRIMMKILKANAKVTLLSYTVMNIVNDVTIGSQPSNDFLR